MTDLLLATCWTSAGDVRPGITPDESPLPIEERVRAVAESGYAGIGFEYSDLIVARDTIGWSGLREAIAASGLIWIQVEFVDDWFVSGERRAISDRRRADLLEAAAELGADHIKVGGGRESDRIDPDVLRQEFARFAQEAGEHGTKIALEPGAFSALKDLDVAIDLVVDVADRRGGLLLDVWHLARTGYEYARLIDRVPSWAVIGVELDDGRSEHGDDLFADTFDNRVLTGRGDFAVPEFVRAIRAIGFDGPWGVENMSIEHRSLDVRTALARARDAAWNVLEGTLI